MPFNIVDGIQPGEVERRVTCEYDWTEDWDWSLTFQWGDPNPTDRRWRAWGHIYLKNLPELLREKIPWKDAQQLDASLCGKYKFEWKYIRPWRFREPADTPP